MTNRNQHTRSFALTLRPKNGVSLFHENRLHKYLNVNATQWEIYEEMTDNDPTTRHLHGRVLFTNKHRMDKIKVKLIRAMEMDLKEKTVLQNGIKWLYDDWEYARKDGKIWERNITDEDEWEYADPAHKFVKQKNADIHHWLNFIEESLPPQVTWQLIQRRITRYMVKDMLEMPKNMDNFKKKCEVIAFYWNAKNALIDDPEDEMSD